MSETLERPAPACGRIRVEPEDFRVYEEVGVEPDGEGEHLWLKLRKREWNTEDLAVWLARQAGVPRRRVNYSGRKDRRAVTEQWFSIHLPGQADPAFDWPPGVEELLARRHRRKLQRGTHRANRFVLRVRDLRGDPEALEAGLAKVAAEGVPNYFGAQRFGAHNSNALRGRAWLLGTGEAPRKRALRGLWLSAVRSELFNRVLAARVEQGCWNRLLDGDILQPEGSRGLFREADEPDAVARLAAGEIHPTAPLPGAGGMASSGACARLEARVLEPDQALVEALAQAGVDAARRATRLAVQALDWQRQDTELELEFRLPAGAFATTVLAQLLELEEQD